MSDLAGLLDAGKLHIDADLGRLTTYKMGGRAAYLVDADSESDVIAAARLAVSEGLEVFPLGRGSNLLVASSGFEGVVVRCGRSLSAIEYLDDGLVSAGGGCPLPVLARESVDAGRGGLEFFTGIPGSVGGAVRMNAGCHGSETADRLVTARIVDMGTGQAVDRSVADLGLAYRSSNLTDVDFVVSATFVTVPIDPADGKSEIREVTRWRRDHQPGGTLNAGSVFKNPPGDAAGRLIDMSGLKGLSVGGASVSKRHANFIVADSGATPEDVNDLIEEVRRRVAESTGILLEVEIRRLGRFS